MTTVQTCDVCHKRAADDYLTANYGKTKALCFDCFWADPSWANGTAVPDVQVPPSANGRVVDSYHPAKRARPAQPHPRMARAIREGIAEGFRKAGQTEAGAAAAIKGASLGNLLAHEARRAGHSL